MKSYLINNDARQQIFPFFRYFGPSAFDGDYISDYYLACYPLGYRGLYALFAWFGVDPLALSRHLPHLLWLLTVVLLGAAANRLGGKLAALAAMALALGSNAYLWRIGGGLPRGFGFPILAGTLVSLAYGRAFWCAASVALGALFYPVSAVISGLSLAGMVLAPKLVGLEPPSWSWPRRVAFVAGTALLAGCLLLPTALASSRYGGVVRPDETREFPEAGRGGRYDEDSRPPFKGFFVGASEMVGLTLLGARPPWSHTARAWLMGSEERRTSERFSGLEVALLVMALTGGAGLLLRRSPARRVLALGVASYVGHALASAVAPYAYLPERYVAYSVPLLVTLIVTTLIVGLFPLSFDEGPRRWVRTLVHGAYLAMLLFLLAGRVSPGIGMDVDIRSRRPVLKYVARLPRDVLVAGWPTGPVEEIPLFSRRRVLMNEEVHQAFHKGYVEEMRHRMRRLVDAYFATSLKPILRLRDELGVTHLLIQRSHFGSRPPRYFRPFNHLIARRLSAARKKGFELPRQIEASKVFSFRDYVLLDLSRLEPGAARDRFDSRAGLRRRRRKCTRCHRR